MQKESIWKETNQSRREGYCHFLSKKEKQGSSGCQLSLKKKGGVSPTSQNRRNQGVSSWEGFSAIERANHVVNVEFGASNGLDEIRKQNHRIFTEDVQICEVDMETDTQLVDHHFEKDKTESGQQNQQNLQYYTTRFGWDMETELNLMEDIIKQAKFLNSDCG
ncbi:hypothetical protein U1Q18_046092 [Sarracenia purpurea var. burkii]